MLLNLAILAVVGLIAYWWAHEGLFSAVLHFACVVVAGAIALAFWEPLTARLLPIKAMEPYAAGLALGVPFALGLGILRVICDKVAPGNLNFPQWVNWAFGLPVGAASGVLTAGILLISAGMMQSHLELLGFVGWARNQEKQGLPGPNNAQWMPVALWTERFYGALGNGAFSPPGKDSLAQVAPDISRMALSMHRDSYLDGQCRTSVAPGSVRVGTLWHDPTWPCGDSLGAYGVAITFDSPTFDSGSSLTLSASQARLLARGKSRGIYVFPVQWAQPLADGSRSIFPFDDLNNYASSISGQAETELLLIFPSAPFEGHPPAFIEVKGSRFALGQPQDAGGGMADAASTGEVSRLKPEALAGYETCPTIPAEELAIDPMAGITLSKNEVGNQIEIVPRGDYNYLGNGSAEFSTGANRSVGKSLRVDRILSKPGALIVKVSASRGRTVVDLDKFRKRLGKEAESARVALIDENGGIYYPIGYIRRGSRSLAFKIDAVNYLKTLGEIPPLPTSGADEFTLLFDVTAGARLVGFVIGDEMVARTDRLVQEQY